MACDTTDNIEVRIRQRSYLPEQAGFSIHVVDSRRGNIDGRRGSSATSADVSGGLGDGSIDVAEGLPGWTIQRNASYLIDEYRPGPGSDAGVEMQRAVLVVSGDGQPPRARMKEWRREEMRKR